MWPYKHEVSHTERFQSRKYKLKREDFPALPHFSDFEMPVFQNATDKTHQFIMYYYQWLHCAGNWGEEHSMCKKMRWFVEKTTPEWYMEKWEERRALGHFDYTLLYGLRPWKEFEPWYTPVKKNRKGAYEFWQDRNFEPLYTPDAVLWKEHAPILHDMFVKGKKPVEE